jgi:hypothetical protein
VFLQSPNQGIGVVEGRFFPVPQARTVPAAKATGHERIFSDPKTDRIFVLTGFQENRVRDYLIYQADDAPEPPPPPD